MTVGPKTIVVIGGSFVGLAVVDELLKRTSIPHRIILIEPHSHMHYLFAWPRYAVLAGHEHKGFVPYTKTFHKAADSSRHVVIQARAVSLQKNEVELDREWNGSRIVPFEYAVIATGTRLSPPGTVGYDEKPDGIRFFQDHQEKVRRANSVVIVGGGAVGVQLATDLAEVHPSKKVTLVHSRDRLLHAYHPKLDEVVRERCKELGVNVITETRAVIPAQGWPSDGSRFELELKDGRRVETELLISATGQTANSQFVKDLETSSGVSTLLNPENNFIRVFPTLQFQDPQYPNLFAVGDIADTGARKAARPGAEQAAVAAENIEVMIAGGQPSKEYNTGGMGIKLSLGLNKYVFFVNPAKGNSEPTCMFFEDGHADMGIGPYGVWEGRGLTITSQDDYYL